MPQQSIEIESKSENLIFELDALKVCLIADNSSSSFQAVSLHKFNGHDFNWVKAMQQFKKVSIL